MEKQKPEKTKATSSDLLKFENKHIDCIHNSDIKKDS